MRAATANGGRSAFGGYFPMPTPGPGGQCVETSYGRFMEPVRSNSCARVVDDLQTSCETALSPQRFVDVRSFTIDSYLAVSYLKCAALPACPFSFFHVNNVVTIVFFSLFPQRVRQPQVTVFELRELGERRNRHCFVSQPAHARRVHRVPRICSYNLTPCRGLEYDMQEFCRRSMLLFLLLAGGCHHAGLCHEAIDGGFFHRLWPN